MKNIKILAALFIALVAMSSCTSMDNPAVEPEPTTSDEAVKAELFGTWYATYDATGTINGKTYTRVVEYYQFPEILGELNMGQWNRYFFAEADDEDPIDDLAGGSGATGLFDYTVASNGTITLQLTNLYLATYDLSYYAPTPRTLQFADGQLTAQGVDSRQITFALANDAVEEILMIWHVSLYGGDGQGGGTYGTDISDEYANEPSLVRQR